MIAFIDQYRDCYGVEPICTVLPIAPSTYYRHKARELNPSLRPDRLNRDEQLSIHIDRIWKDNYSVYGVRKVWHQMKLEGISVARCTVARLMKRLGFAGVIRGKKDKQPRRKQRGIAVRITLVGRLF